MGDEHPAIGELHIHMPEPAGPDLPATPTGPPTWGEAVGQAAAVLREARTVCGTDSATRLMNVADSWVNVAREIDRHGEVGHQ